MTTNILYSYLYSGLKPPIKKGFKSSNELLGAPNDHLYIFYTNDHLEPLGIM